MAEKENNKNKKELSLYKKTLLIMIAAIILLSLPALSSEFCDWYNDNVYGILCDAISHVTALFPFAVGEILMYTGVMMLIAAVALLLLLIFLHKKVGYRRFCSIYYKFFSIVLLSVFLIYIPTWFIPFNGSVLGQGDKELRTSFTFEEIRDLLWYCADGANAAAEEIYIAPDGSVEFYSSEKITEMAADAMRDLGSEYGRLKGYYPPVKAALCSDILERMGIGGYNYPYTMEPTHNRYCSPLFQAVLDAHEYAHHKGYYQENEANFLSELALSKNSDPYLRMEGFYEMYAYLYVDYIEASNEIPEEMPGEDPCLSDRVYYIQNAATEIEQQMYEADEHPIDDMPAVDELITDTADQGWEIQGEIIQERSYDDVVLLLLQYFYSPEYTGDFKQK